MIEIVRRGAPPSEKVYEIECRKCRSLLKFKPSDVKMNYDQRDGNFFSFNCPVCNDYLTKDV